MGLSELKKIRDALKQVDADMRAASICLQCGKPQNGIIQPGKTKEQAGLCTCVHIPDESEVSNDQG